MNLTLVFLSTYIILRNLTKVFLKVSQCTLIIGIFLYKSLNDWPIAMTHADHQSTDAQ